LVLCLAAAPVLAGQRIALVIGNGTYTATSALPNAANDAADMAATLEALGFEVFAGIDLSRLDSLRLIDSFTKALGPEDTALFYFAGHGLQIGSENYLMPVDAEPGDEIGLTNSSIKLQSVLRAMELRADSRIVILDACRNNPFLLESAARSSSGGGAARGLSKIEAGVGSYIAFSTQPGNVALDGRGRNSPFTAALLRNIRTAEDIHAVMRAVRAEVVQGSNGTQIPWENSSLIDAVYLAPPAPERAGVPLQRREEQTAIARPAPAAPAAPPALARPPAAIAVPRQPATRPRDPGETCVALQEGARLCAASVLADQGGNSYGPANLLDDRPDTAWVEGRTGLGIGDYLALDHDRAFGVHALDLINGYAKSAKSHGDNARVATLRVTASNGAGQTLRLQDSAGWQSHPLEGFDDITWIALEIADAIPGARWADTAISELRLR
jgi:hypothetical protein